MFAETIVSLDGRQLFISLEESSQVHLDNPVYRAGNTSFSSVVDAPGNILTFHIPGDLTYLNAENFLKLSQNVHNSYKAAIVNLSTIAYIDSDSITSLKEIVRHLGEGSKCGIAVCGLRQRAYCLQPVRSTD